MTPKLPDELWLGMTETEWPVYVFISDASLKSFLAESPKNHAWHIRLADIAKVSLVAPKPYLVTETPDQPPAAPARQELSCTSASTERRPSYHHEAPATPFGFGR